MEPGTWLSDFSSLLGDGEPSSTTSVSDEERDALLDLARIAAHTSERWTAPITTYLAGLALADVEPADRGAKLRELVARLE